MEKKALQECHLPTYSELPQFGLYLDQTVKYINGFLTPLDLTALTPAMVSNYVKQGLIAPPIKKQYDAEQLAYLLFIAIVKSVLPMDNIKRLVQLQKQTYPAQIAYDYFCMELQNMLCVTFGIKDTIDEIGTNNSEVKTMVRSVIIAVSQLIYFESCLKAYNSISE